MPPVSRILYSLIVALALPLAFARLLWRSAAEPAYRRGWAQRLGLATAAAPSGCIWLHAVSVGEVNAAIPLIEGLLQAHPDTPLLVTTTTPTGARQVRARLGTRVHHCYLPYDMPAPARDFCGATSRASASSWKPKSGPTSMRHAPYLRCRSYW